MRAGGGYAGSAGGLFVVGLIFGRFADGLAVRLIAGLLGGPAVGLAVQWLAGALAFGWLAVLGVLGC